jgi:hypothetical protein
MQAVLLSSKLKEYILNEINSMAKTNPLIGFTKPILTRVVDKNYTKIRKAIDFIADNEGNVDIENILPEMIESVMNTEPFKINTDFIGDIEIGGGLIKLQLPMTSKSLILDTNDLEKLKTLLIEE